MQNVQTNLRERCIFTISETNFSAWGDEAYWFALEERLLYRNYDL